MSQDADLAIAKTVTLSFDETVARVEARLAEQGFGILTRIDVRATLAQKLGVEMPAFTILGACNPGIAHRALEIEPQVSLLLPCNVVVRDLGGGRVRVEALNPALMASMFPGSAALAPLAADARARIESAVAAV